MILTDEELKGFVADWAEHHYSTIEEMGRAVEREVLRKLRERPADAWATPFGEVLNAIGLDELPLPYWTPLHIIPEVNE